MYKMKENRWRLGLHRDTMEAIECEIQSDMVYYITDICGCTNEHDSCFRSDHAEELRTLAREINEKAQKRKRLVARIINDVSNDPSVELSPEEVQQLEDLAKDVLYLYRMIRNYLRAALVIAEAEYKRDMKAFTSEAAKGKSVRLQVSFVSDSIKNVLKDIRLYIWSYTAMLIALNLQKPKIVRLICG
jgi:uncharacterized protein with von Willebrand factor type A (vWA) domain